ncbi:hypothetical protein SAMN04488511_102277 [Pedobacter suwonensis]|uniref:Peptidase_C39 like family protein n=1 Tax=Pedobacter suwonensis TaxID=332999 RepID=A0A1I0SP02_9SPHI|nr:hypothetical protein [Pedobacter suwonensis]SFA41240.1 hypothetical protein SAMN04488511_102277 [Pedobacter suwonensis]
MKKNALLVLSLLLCGCLLIFACRKDLNNYLLDRDSASSPLIESAKIWRLRNLTFDKANGTAPSKILKPHWQDAWQIKSSDGSLLLIVPTSEHFISNSDVKVRRFFVFTTKNGNVEKGRILELIGFKYNVEANLDLILKNIGSNISSDFSGSVIEYDINYRRLNSIGYLKGKKIDMAAEIINIGPDEIGHLYKSAQKKGGTGKLMLSGNNNLVMSQEDCPYVQPVFLNFPATLCQDGYVTVEHSFTYDPLTGCLLSETYTYMYQTCPGVSTSNPGQGSGSGSGSGSGTGSSNPDYGGNPGGGGSVQEQLADTDFDWSDISDNEVLTDPNADEEFDPFQNGPFPKVTNVIAKDKFVPFRTVNGEAVNCLTLSKEMLAKKGYTCSGYLPSTQTFQTFGQNGVNLNTTQKAITYLQSALSQGIPVLVGVDAFAGSSNADNVTDHFVVIVGSGVDPVKGNYFNFYDSSTNNSTKGTSDQNRLYYNSTTGKISGPTQTGYTSQASNPGHDYIVTQVRKSIPKP